MTKSTYSSSLSRKLLSYMEQVGQQIKLARLRRKLSVEQVAERSLCSTVTLLKVEKGNPKVAIGTYLRVLNVLGLEEDFLLIAKNDKLGQVITDIDLLKKRAPKRIFKVQKD